MTKSHQPAAKQSAAPPVAAAASPLQMRPFAPRQDDLEQDGMADLMARAMGTQLMDMPVDAPGAAVQRQAIPEEEEEELPVQPKLSIGQPGDKYEQEADQMAARVMRMPGGDLGNRAGEKGKGEGVQWQALPGEKEEEEEEVQMKPAVQREVIPGEEEEEETLQARLQSKGEAPAVPENFENQLANHKGGGRPLSDETRGFMEPRFGADFSGVRVHETPNLANAIQAQAFTHGQDIYFNSGKYSPGSSGGKELLAHELTHVVQQNTSLTDIQLNLDYPKAQHKQKENTSLKTVNPNDFSEKNKISLQSGSSNLEDQVNKVTINRQSQINAFLNNGSQISSEVILVNLPPGKYIIEYSSLDGAGIKGTDESQGYYYVDQNDLNAHRIYNLIRRTAIYKNIPLIVRGISRNPANSAISYNRSRGYSEETVIEMQELVGLQGKDVDGIIGSKTVKAIRNWQSENGINPDGKVGPVTYEAMFGYASVKEPEGENDDQEIIDGDTSDQRVPIIFQDGWNPGIQNENSESLRSFLLKYYGDEIERKQIHRQNLDFLHNYFAAYDGYLEQYRELLKDIQTEVELRKLGKFKPPQKFPIESLDANLEEYKELLLAQDSDTFLTWKEISNKISNIRGKIPAGTIFFRANFSVNGRLGIHKVGFETNIDVGSNDYIDAGAKVSETIELVEGGEVTTTIDLENGDTTIEGATEIKGQKGGLKYSVSRDHLGRNTADVTVSKGEWEASINSDGRLRVSAPALGIIGVEGQTSPSEGEAVVGPKLEIKNKDGKKIASVFMGVGFVGLSYDAALQTIVGQGYFESNPDDYEKMRWDELANRQFQQGLAANPLIHKNAQQAYIELGFDSSVWNSFTGNPQDPAAWGKSMKKFWAELNQSEKIAAISLGYYDSLWDYRASKLVNKR